jgi:Flp pilus assembly protein TadD
MVAERLASLRRIPRARALVAVVFFVLAVACDRGSELSDQDIIQNNRGVALMGYFDYRGARDAFAEVVQRQPQWLDARVNLAIATLNMQQEGGEQRALEILSSVLESDPTHLRAQYVSGLLRLYLGQIDGALEHLQRVARADPGDAYAVYFVAQALLQQGDLEGALENYQRAIELDPYLRSGYYGAGLVLRRLDRADEAREMLSDYERFADNPRARLAEFKYTRMGAKAETMAVDRPEPTRDPLPDGPLFAAPRDIDAPPGGAPARLTAADIDADGVLDLYRVSTSGSLVLEARGEDGYRAVVDHPLSGIAGISAALWGDVDNDGNLDAYLCRLGSNQLWLGAADGTWTEAGAETGTDDAGYCSDAGLIDADHDGDLDIFVVNSNGPDELFSNNLDGSFRRLAVMSGIEGGAGPGQFLPADLDGDRDTDLIVVRQTGSDVWFNDRLWQYRPAPGFDRFRSAALIAAVAGDRDADGRTEVYAIDSNGELALWAPAKDGEWRPSPVARVDGESPGLALADFNGDGRVDLMAVSSAGVVILTGEENRVLVDEYAELSGPLIVLNGDAARGPSLAGPTLAGLRVWAPGTGRHRFLALQVTGKEDRADSMRSNRSGIGTRISLRTLDRWTITDNFDRNTAPGQSLQPVLLGLGGREAADFVALDWTDGVFQTELDLGAGEIHTVAETQRQLSSCPIIFAWDGQAYAFVSDILGVGGLGFFVAPGEYAPPRPWERFLMPEELPAERNGRYQIKITEPMEENAYLDTVALQVFDLPPGWDMVTDERMGTGEPEVTGRPIYFRSERAVVAATNDRGDDVTGSIAASDHVAAPPGMIDDRFIGRLRAPHALTLAFDEVINPMGSQPVLVADGWVEYPYSQTVFAAWQAGATYDPPDLEALDENGEWHLVHADFGYPAGMPRVMALPLNALPPGTVSLRLTTSQEVYWDRLRVVYEEQPPEVRAHEMRPLEARLGKTGFPLRRNGPQRLPDYDYSVRQTFWDARYLDGYYTVMGPVDPLLAEADDAVVIVGSGEEVHLEFAVPPPAPAGWRRRIVVDARGWAKDMDLYTLGGGRVGPLPVSEGRTQAEQARRRDLHDRFNLRYQSGR